MTGADQLEVKIHFIIGHDPHCAPIAVLIDHSHIDGFSKDQARCELFGLLAEVLVLLMGVNTIEPDLFAFAIVHHSDCVAPSETPTTLPCQPKQRA